MDTPDSLVPIPVIESVLFTPNEDTIRPLFDISMELDQPPPINRMLSMRMTSNPQDSVARRDRHVCNELSPQSQYTTKVERKSTLIENPRLAEFCDQNGPFHVVRPPISLAAGDGSPLGILRPQAQSKSRSKSGKRRFRWNEQHSQLLHELVSSSRLKNNSSDKKLVCQVFPGFSQRFVKQKLKEITCRINSQEDWKVEEDVILFKNFLKGITDWTKVQQNHFPNKSLKEVCERVDALRKSQLRKIAHLGKRQSTSPHLHDRLDMQRNKHKRQRLPKTIEVCDTIDAQSKYQTISTCPTLPIDCFMSKPQSSGADIQVGSAPKEREAPLGGDQSMPVGFAQDMQTKDLLSDLPRLLTNKAKLFSFEARLEEDLNQPDGIGDDPLWNNGANISKLLHTSQEDCWLSWHT